MARIKIDPNRINDLATKERNIKSKTNDCQAAVRTVVRNLDWKVSSSSNIDTRLKKVQKRLNAQSELMDEYINVLTAVSDNLATKDRNIKNMAKELVYLLNQMSFVAAFTGSKPKTDWKKSEVLDKIIHANMLFNVSIASAVIGLEAIKNLVGASIQNLKDAKELQDRIDKLTTVDYPIGKKGAGSRKDGNASGCHGFAVNFLGDLHGIEGFFKPNPKKKQRVDRNKH